MADETSKKVTLHQFAPTERILNVSPPCLKLETYLRMAKIPYESDYRMCMSKKGKMPWIEYNGQEIADSNFCIRFLNKEFNVDLNEHLSASEKATAHCIQTMLEENTYWVLAYNRWLDKEYEQIMKTTGFFGGMSWPVKNLAFWKVQKSMRENLHGHGMGRHSQEAIYSIGERDLRAVAEILGDKEFMFGDKPCLLDAVVFPFVASCMWDIPEQCPMNKLVSSELKNLERHAQRMKEAYFPDWDEIIKSNA